MRSGEPVPTCLRCGKAHVREGGRVDVPTCNAHTRRGLPCMRWPLEGATVCKLHGGGTPQVRRVAELRRMKAELNSLGGSIDVSPTEAMLEAVREAAWNVAYLRTLVEALRPDVDADAPVIIDEDGVATVHPAWVGAGVAGREDPSNWKASPHVLVRMYNEERDRLVKYAALCRHEGVEERMVKAMEEQGRWLATAIDKVLDALGLTEQQQAQLPTIMGRVIEELGEGT